MTVVMLLFCSSRWHAALLTKEVMRLSHSWKTESTTFPLRAIRCFFFSSRRRHTRFDCDWSSDVCSSDLDAHLGAIESLHLGPQLHKAAARLAVGQFTGELQHGARVNGRQPLEAGVAGILPRVARVSIRPSMPRALISWLNWLR